ncbi:hypothetical protein AB0J86_37265 [Micromonospora sp. NPDC049559]|uniref:hypothetical protein n=1 Tax=Micromonospora sp. NPDC049559 TaxID=3155923 RepID=UPI003430FF01
MPAEPKRPVLVPQQPLPSRTGHPLDELPEAVEGLRRLAARHAGRPVAGRFDRTGWRLMEPA